MIEPKDGEWWMCDRNGVAVPFYNDEGRWCESDQDKDYNYSDAKPLYRMVKDWPLEDEKPKPRTKVVYEHLTQSDTSVWDLKEMLERGELFTKRSDNTYNLYSRSAECYMISHFIAYGVYRKVEKEIDWKDELAERAGLVYDKASDSFDMNGKYWDSNWVKEFGQLVASLTDKPE